MDIELALINLKELKKVLDEFDIEFWLDGGTLLGAVREGRMIEWDDDIDLCIWDKDATTLYSALVELRRRKGELSLAYPIYPGIKSITLKPFPYDCNIDIVMWPDKNGKNPILTIESEGMFGRLTITQRFLYLIQEYFSLIRHYLYSDFSLRLARTPDNFVAKVLKRSLPLLPHQLKAFSLNILRHWKVGYSKWIIVTPRHFFEKLETIEFCGMTFHVPSDVEEYLKYHYGENWKIPQKKWDWTEDDRAAPIKISTCQTRL